MAAWGEKVNAGPIFFLISWRLGLRTKKTCTYNNENLQASRRLEGRMVAVLGRVVDKCKLKFKSNWEYEGEFQEAWLSGSQSLSQIER